MPIRVLISYFKRLLGLYLTIRPTGLYFGHMTSPFPFTWSSTLLLHAFISFTFIMDLKFTQVLSSAAYSLL